MPTYEYGCKSCGYRFEEFQSIVDDPVKVCPKCNKETVQRFVSRGAGLIFKGSGFYITDYKKKNSSSNGETGRNGSTQKKSSEEKPSKSADKD